MILSRVGLRSIIWVTVLAVCATSLHAQTLYLMIAADTSAQDIGSGCTANIQNVTQCFESGVAPNQLVIRTVSGDQLTRDNIINEIRSIRAGRNDAIVLIGSCHGAHDWKGHHLYMRDGTTRLYRSELVREIRNRGAGTDVLITEACNVLVPPTFGEARRLVPATTTRPLFHSLFFDARGLVDINSSSEGEESLTNRDNGGLFMQRFCSLLIEHSDRRLAWREFAPMVNLAVKQLYVPPIRDAIGKLHYDVNMRVWHLPPRWPPKDMGLRTGDRILTINGSDIAGPDECRVAIQNSPRDMVFTVASNRNGEIWRLEASLQDGQDSRFGISLDDGNRNGAYIRRVSRGSPASASRVLERVSPYPP